MTSAVTRIVQDMTEGLTFRGFDLQTGIVSPYGVLRLLLLSRGLMFQDGELMQLRKLSKHDGQRFYFIASSEVTMSRDIYQLPSPVFPTAAAMASLGPAVVTTELLSYRKSSYVLSSKLFTSGKHVATFNTNMVYIDPASRRPVSLPDWWTEKYREFHMKTTGPNFKGFSRETDTFCRGVRTNPVTLTAPRRDQDSLNHINTFSYFQYCIDAIENHLHTNNIECDIYTVSMLLKRLQYIHLGESRAGDILSVAFWDDKSDPNSVCFDISKSGQSVYQAKMEFYNKDVLDVKANL